MPQPWERRRVVYRRPIGPVAARRIDEPPEDYVRRREDDERRLREADRDAYDRGRRDGRRSHRSHPILTFVVLALAALGLVFIGLWARSGSPSQAGAQIGTAAAVASERTQDAAVVATDRAQQTAGELGDRFERAREGRPAPTPAPDATASTTTTSTTASSTTQR